MSADNYYIIQLAPDGKFVPVMGFASDERIPAIRDDHPRFDFLEDALAAAQREHSEYGVSVSDAAFRAARQQRRQAKRVG